MTKCLICNQEIVSEINLLNLFSFKKISQRMLCIDCQKSFRKIDQNHCPQCYRQQDSTEICFDCTRWRQNEQIVLKNYAIYQYNDSMHDLIKSYKRYGDYCLCKVFQQLLFENGVPQNFDYFIPIATDPSHVQNRGFDTIKEIFEPIFPLTNCLEKQSGVVAQSQKNRRERMETPQTFNCKSNQLSGKILLLDDLYTTGRTLYHARNAILAKNPNCQISSFTIIR